MQLRVVEADLRQLAKREPLGLREELDAAIDLKASELRGLCRSELPLCAQREGDEPVPHAAWPGQAQHIRAPCDDLALKRGADCAECKPVLDRQRGKDLVHEGAGEQQQRGGARRERVDTDEAPSPPPPACQPSENFVRSESRLLFDPSGFF